MKNYGTPISHLNKPHQPFKLRTWHVLTGLAVIGLAGYGAYRLFAGVKDNFKGPNDFNFKKRKEEDKENDKDRSEPESQG
jgi:hypothetical protein